MNRQAWLSRLAAQLPGWHVWYCSPGITPGHRWNATPAPADANHAEVLRMPNRISAAIPQELRTLCRDRYGWDDHCETCGVLARECGHRTPEAGR